MHRRDLGAVHIRGTKLDYVNQVDRVLAHLRSFPGVARLPIVEAGLGELVDVFDLPRAEMLTGVLE